MTRPTQDSSPPGAIRPSGWPWRLPQAPWRLLLCAALSTFLLACSGGAGGGSDGAGGGSNEPPLATEPVDLPPGQTVAQLAWEPSAGNISGYMIFVSRNAGSFDFDQLVADATVTITGAAGDAVQIVVLAVGEDGRFSESSPPSVPIRFHAAIVEQVANNTPPVTPLVGDAADAGSDATSDPGSPPAIDEPAPTPPAPAPPPADETADAGSPAASDGDPAAEPTNPALFTPALRRSLLLADVRQPLAGLGSGAAAWLQSQLSGELDTNLVLIATAARSGDSLRDLVWRDASGRLFLADADLFAEAEDPASTLVETIQLRNGERFVDLRDLDGDGARDWIVEDPATGAVWLRASDGLDDRAARASALPETTRLVGSGDFDGDGRSELLWQHEDRSLALARPAGGAPLLSIGAAAPAGNQIVALADLTGDGLDDLIARNDLGHLAVGLVSLDPESGSVAIEWSEGHLEADPSVELMATVDLDSDGRAELAWLVGETVEVRALGETTPRAFEF